MFIMLKSQEVIHPKGESPVYRWPCVTLVSDSQHLLTLHRIAHLFLHLPSSSSIINSVIEYMSFSDAEAAVKTLDGVEMRGSVVRVKEGQAAPGQSWENPVSHSNH